MRGIMNHEISFNLWIYNLKCVNFQKVVIMKGIELLLERKVHTFYVE